MGADMSCEAHAAAELAVIGATGGVWTSRETAKRSTSAATAGDAAGGAAAGADATPAVDVALAVGALGSGPISTSQLMV